MGIPTPRRSENVIEIDDKGRAHLFVDGIPVQGVMGIETDYSRGKEGVVYVRLSARCVRYRMVESSRKIVPSDEVI